jgi:ABC-type uncharacterized transport system permease subunit
VSRCTAVSSEPVGDAGDSLAVLPSAAAVVLLLLLLLLLLSQRSGLNSAASGPNVWLASAMGSAAIITTVPCVCLCDSSSQACQT